MIRHGGHVLWSGRRMPFKSHLTHRNSSTLFFYLLMFFSFIASPKSNKNFFFALYGKTAVNKMIVTFFDFMNSDRKWSQVLYQHVFRNRNSKTQWYDHCLLFCLFYCLVDSSGSGDVFHRTIYIWIISLNLRSRDDKFNAKKNNN